MPSVLLPSAWSRTEYVVLRSLAAHGIEVHVADVARIGMCQWSRFKTQFWLRRDDQGAIDDLVAIAHKAGVQMLLPTDELTFEIARLRDRFVPNVVVPLAPHETLTLADHKAKLLSLAEDLSIPAPHSYAYESPEEIADVQGPLIVKLPDSRGSKGVWRVETAAEARRLVRELVVGRSSHRYPLVQECVPGVGWGVSRLYWAGEQVAGFTHVRLREKLPIGGTSTLRASAKNAALEEAADRLLRALGWHGLAMVEFRYEAESGRFWLMEVNPRAWGSIALPVHCGVDFPWLLYLCATGRGDQAAAESGCGYPLGVKARWLAGDIAQLVNFAAKGKLRDLLRVISSRADCLDDFRWEDPSAFIGEMIYYLSHRR